MTQRAVAIRVVVVPIFAALLFASGDARAQAWVPDQGSLELSVDYNFARSDQVISTKNLTLKDAGTDTHQFVFGASFVPLEHLALDVSVPLESLKYTGNKTMYPHPGGGGYDDGQFHNTFTDFRGGVRYQVLEEPIVISPQIGVSVPMQKYETVGNTVAGRHLSAAHFGVNIGKFITDALYAHLLYEFSLVDTYNRTPETDKIGQNTSDISATIGYKLLDDKLDLHINGDFHITHGGVNLADLNFASKTDPIALYHDPLLRENQYLVGGGVGYQITDWVGITASARVFVGGVNTQNASVLALGLTLTPL